MSSLPKDFQEKPVERGINILILILIGQKAIGQQSEVTQRCAGTRNW